MNTEREKALITHALIADLHNERGGASINLKTGQQPTRGFMVSLRGYERREPKAFIIGFDVFEYLRDNVQNARRQVQGDNVYVGTWYDESANETVFDISVNVEHIGDAFAIAIANKQSAIYDVVNQRVIALD